MLNRHLYSHMTLGTLGIERIYVFVFHGFELTPLTIFGALSFEHSV